MTLAILAAFLAEKTSAWKPFLILPCGCGKKRGLTDYTNGSRTNLNHIMLIEGDNASYAKVVKQVILMGLPNILLLTREPKKNRIICLTIDGGVLSIFSFIKDGPTMPWPCKPLHTVILTECWRASKTFHYY